MTSRAPDGVGPDVRTTFLEAGAAFADVAASLDPARLGDGATPAWTLRELVAHATRGLLAVEATVRAPLDPASRALAGAADYFAVAMAAPGVHEGIEQRARDGARALGDDPGAYARDALGSVTPIVRGTPLDREVQHVAGRLRFDAYLATRVVELTLHTCDVLAVLGRPVAFPEAPSALTCDVLLALTGRVGALAVACALTARAGPACNVLG